ncbi:ABC transporter permease [Paenarthrobacter sp. NPDC056912]|uniref:ABC transporter permease n=1 Tax=Paenarthrobacter sp. NPDC056912 TaxID=3345965 RepID=UPI00366B18F4
MIENTTNPSIPLVRAKGSVRNRISAILLPFLGMVAVVALWWIAVAGLRIEKFLLPSPADVVDSFLKNPQFLLLQSLVTLWETIQGFILAILIGVPAAMAIASSRLLERTVYPLLLGINAVPKVAIAPLLVVWMGFGQEPKVVMVMLLCFFPIVLSTTAGLRSTPTELIELGLSMRASRLQMFMKFRFPFATEQIFVGLKTAISLAVIGAVIGEFVGANAGLGYVIVQSGASADTSQAFACIVLLALISIGLFYLLVALERLLIPWSESNRS